MEKEKFWPPLWRWRFDFVVLAMSDSHMWYRQNDEPHSKNVRGIHGVNIVTFCTLVNVLNRVVFF